MVVLNILHRLTAESSRISMQRALDQTGVINLSFDDDSHRVSGSASIVSSRHSRVSSSPKSKAASTVESIYEVGTSQKNVHRETLRKICGEYDDISALIRDFAGDAPSPGHGLL